MTDTEFNILDELLNLQKELRESKPYTLNILDEIHANENAHTRILTKLLKYNPDKNYSVLKSFLSFLGEDFDCGGIISPVVVTNKDFIDALIREGKKYAVIVENKIHSAADQPRQIERYLDGIIKSGVKKDNIFVIYLTLDGFKKASDESLTEKAKSILSYSQKGKSRFTELNYRDNILPWLKESVLPNIPVKEDVLLSALKQYVDYLEGRFCKRSEDLNRGIKMKNYIEEKLKLAAESPSGKYAAINDFAQETANLTQTLNNIKEGIYITAIKTLLGVTKDIYNNLYGQGFEVVYNRQWSCIQVAKKSWRVNNALLIHFEWTDINYNFLMSNETLYYHYHIEGDEVEKDVFKKILYDKFPQVKEWEDKYRVASHSGWLWALPFSPSKPLADMTEQEIKNFLLKLYEESKAFVEYTDEAIVEYLKM